MGQVGDKCDDISLDESSRNFYFAPMELQIS